jgi:hydrogenase nickel incorporation protein HypB
MKIEVRRAIYEENDRLAGKINAELKARGIFTVNILGSPGAGKTSLIARILERMPGEKAAVIEGDVASDIDTRTLRALGVDAWQIETGGDCHLNAAMIEGILGKMTVAEGSWLFIENIGNLVCPAEFVVGEDIKIVVASVAEGHDKPVKYPMAFARSAACVMTKTDLALAVGFDEAFFRSALESTSPGIPLFPLNGRTGEGVDAFVSWLKVAREAGNAVR